MVSYEELHKIKMKKRYEKKKIDGQFTDMKIQFLKTAQQRRHMKKIKREEMKSYKGKKILNKQTKLINTPKEKDD